MSKVVRNTVFTAVALALTVIGIHWNKDLTLQADPLAVNRSVVASQPNGQGVQNFPLEIKFYHPEMKLGQTQQLSVATVPFAELEIVTAYPNGSTNNDQTLIAKADQNGRFELRYKLNSFDDLGVFRTSVVATSATKTSDATSVFVLQPWATGNNPDESEYIHPLLP